MIIVTIFSLFLYGCNWRRSNIQRGEEKGRMKAGNGEDKVEEGRKVEGSEYLKTKIRERERKEWEKREEKQRRGQEV